MLVHVHGTRVVTERCDFVFDAPDEMSLVGVEELVNDPINFCKLHDYVDYVSEGSEATQFKVSRNKKRPTTDDTVITMEDLCRMN